jgi:hypothetical protein
MTPLPYGSGVRFVSSRLTPDEREMFPQMSSHVCIDLPAGRRLCVSPSEEDADLIAGALNALYSLSRVSRADSRRAFKDAIKGDAPV